MATVATVRPTFTQRPSRLPAPAPAPYNPNPQGGDSPYGHYDIDPYAPKTLYGGGAQMAAQARLAPPVTMAGGRTTDYAGRPVAGAQPLMGQAPALSVDRGGTTAPGGGGLNFPNPPPAPSPSLTQAGQRPTYNPGAGPGYQLPPPYGPTPRDQEVPLPSPSYTQFKAGVNKKTALEEALLGPDLGKYINENQPWRPSYYKQLQARLNYENILKAEDDRKRGVESLQQSYGQVGASPEAGFAREMAAYRLANPDIMNPQEVSMQEAAVRARGARGYQDAEMLMQQDQAARGIRGPMGSYDLARLGQGYDRQIADELQNQALQLASGREEKERGALGDLSKISTDEEVRRMAILQAIADAFLNTERGPIDLSALTKR